MNLGIGRVQNITADNLFLKEKSLHKFIDSAKGKKYEELDKYCSYYYSKDNLKYFGQIITPINLMGLIQVNDEGKLIENELLSKVLYSRNLRLSNYYMNYFLCMWQFPIPSTKQSYGRDRKVFKPYCLLLKLLLEMNKINEEEAYLTSFDYSYLFLDDSIEKMIEVDEIDSNYAKWVIETRLERKARGDSQENGSLTYIINTLNESDFLTKDKLDYNSVEDFYIGLKRVGDTIDMCNFIIRKYQNQYFEFDIEKPYNDRQTLSDYGKFVNDIEKYKIWRKCVLNISRINEFALFCDKKGFYYTEDVIRRFVLSLETKPFLILTGISGSGKTKIAELWTMFLREKNEACGIQIAVGSNWTDNKKLLGFKNILLEEGNNYQSSELVDLMKEANKEENSEKEYIVILDEMNLSRVEMYFADFLSALESIQHSIILPNGECVIWSENVKIIGTVNVDESTYMFSPKVLDRANVIEMNGISPKAYIESVKNKDGKVYTQIEKFSWYSKYTELLENVYEALNNEFAFRVIDEMSKYLLINTSLYGDSEVLFDKYMDEQLNQKILPKLHGSKAQLKPKLDKLSNIFSEKERYTLVNTKLIKMQEDVKKGYASYIGD